MENFFLLFFVVPKVWQIQSEQVRTWNYIWKSFKWDKIVDITLKSWKWKGKKKVFILCVHNDWLDNMFHAPSLSLTELILSLEETMNVQFVSRFFRFFRNTNTNIEFNRCWFHRMNIIRPQKRKTFHPRKLNLTFSYCMFFFHFLSFLFQNDKVFNDWKCT